LGIEMKRVATFIAFLLVSGQISIAAAAGSEVAINALRKAKREVNWDAKTAVVADVTCDRVPDTIVVGYERDAVWLGVVPGPGTNKSAKLSTMRFPVGTQSQDSFCAVPVHVETYPIACEDEDIGVLPGCKPVKGCLAFSLDDDKCDSFHFYWESSQKALAWWRR
jgi:hypothetical protein